VSGEEEKRDSYSRNLPARARDMAQAVEVLGLIPSTEKRFFLHHKLS
jgi:hypothetical protein